MRSLARKLLLILRTKLLVKSVQGCPASRWPNPVVSSPNAGPLVSGPCSFDCSTQPTSKREVKGSSWNVNRGPARMTVTLKLQLVTDPHESLAVAVTVVVPSGNRLPLGGLAERYGEASHPPLALQVKYTTTPLVLVVVTVRLDEQFTARGGRATVTLKLQLVTDPQESLAVAVTVVLPSGNRLPLGGLAERYGEPSQPPLAAQVKYAMAPFELVADTVRLDEQFTARGGRTTVTSKLQLVTNPQESLAVAVTVVLPSGNRLPLGGLAKRYGEPSQPPLAVQVKYTRVPLVLVVVTVRFEEQFTARGGRTTVTSKLQLVTDPQESAAVAVTVVVPSGNQLPLGGLA